MRTSGQGQRGTSRLGALVSDTETGLMAERDSPRDQLIVVFFLLVVSALLLYAAVRSRWVVICMQLMKGYGKR
jgi:predicted MFS family arabinose efflux permease